MTSFQRAAGVDTSFVGDRAILYERAARQAIVLNPTGSVLWGTLGQNRDDDALVAALRERFPDLPAERARADVDAFLHDLRERRLIEVID